MQILSECFCKSYYTTSYAKDGSRKMVGHNIIAILYFDTPHLKVKSYSKICSIGSFLSVVISLECSYHLNAFSKAKYYIC